MPADCPPPTRQPETDDALGRVVEAMDACPTGAIRHLAVSTEE